MAPRRVMPARLSRCKAPIHNSKSGLTGFFTNTGTSTPRKLSAKACMAKGLATVRAPTHNTSMPCFKHSATCSGVATSVAVNMPVCAFTCCNHGSATSPTPSKPPGLVRGFQTPALNMRQPQAAKSRAVASTCCSVSAEQGPAITHTDCWLPPGK